MKICKYEAAGMRFGEFWTQISGSLDALITLWYWFFLWRKNFYPFCEIQKVSSSSRQFDEFFSSAKEISIRIKKRFSPSSQGFGIFDDRTLTLSRIDLTELRHYSSQSTIFLLQQDFLPSQLNRFHVFFLSSQDFDNFDALIDWQFFAVSFPINWVHYKGTSSH